MLKLSGRQVRRLQRKLEKQGDAALVHGLRGKPSNRRCDAALREGARGVSAALQRFRSDVRLREVGRRELGRVARTRCGGWLLAEGLWQRRRRREPHRRRRPRRGCFGELVQMDTSLHDWTEGRGEEMVLLTMIDDATSRVLARFYPADNGQAHFDLAGPLAEEVWPAAGACTRIATASSRRTKKASPITRAKRSSAGPWPSWTST